MTTSKSITDNELALGAEQNTHLITALDHLDRIIGAYDAPGIVPLVEAIKAAKAWRATVEKTVEHAG